MPSLLVTNDFPPKVGGIQSYLWELWRRLPAADVTVLEAEARPGGKVWTLREEGFTVEAGPNGFLDAKPATLELCRELGCARSVLACSIRLLMIHCSSRWLACAQTR